MSENEFIQPDDVARPRFPYTPVVASGDLVVTAGQVANDATGAGNPRYPVQLRDRPELRMLERRPRSEDAPVVLRGVPRRDRPRLVARPRSAAAPIVARSSSMRSGINHARASSSSRRPRAK